MMYNALMRLQIRQVSASLRHSCCEAYDPWTHEHEQELIEAAELPITLSVVFSACMTRRLSSSSMNASIALAPEGIKSGLR